MKNSTKCQDLLEIAKYPQFRKNIRNLFLTHLVNWSLLQIFYVDYFYFRFSVAVSDFFVPNKTLYKDYIEFIKVIL